MQKHEVNFHVGQKNLPKGNSDLRQAAPADLGPAHAIAALNLDVELIRHGTDVAEADARAALAEITHHTQKHAGAVVPEEPGTSLHGIARFVATLGRNRAPGR